jgi:hypothetical protein
LTAVAHLAHALAPCLQRLPLDEQFPAAVLFGERPVSTLEQFLDRCPGQRRTVERAFGSVGIPSVARLLDGVRLCSTWEGLPLEPTLEAAAARFGYESPRTLSEHYGLFAGWSPRRATRNLTTGDFVDRVAARVSARSNPFRARRSRS